MRIASWNVNGLRARLDFVLHWLAARRPDVVAIQETKIPDELFPRDEIEAAGYRVASHGEKGWNGVAVLARGVEPVVVAQGLAGQEQRGSRLLAVRLGELELINVYVPNGKGITHPDFPLKLEWLDSLLSRTAETARPRTAVLCGDLNLCPAPIDSWNEERLAGTIFHTTEERARFARLIEQGWVDLYRRLHPDRQVFSWWDYRAGAFHRGQGLRIDFVLGTRSVAERVLAAEIDRDYRKKKDGLTASDHAPVWVDLA